MREHILKMLDPVDHTSTLKFGKCTVCNVPVGGGSTKIEVETNFELHVQKENLKDSWGCS